MQMGGGDSLYDKIDKGVRGCSVMLSCVTSKYSLSANCRREVSLADALKKPIVPLLLETMTWPPEGPMSMVFTQLLYINFCKPNQDIQNHWNCPQMEELLGKITQATENSTGGKITSDTNGVKHEKPSDTENHREPTSTSQEPRPASTSPEKKSKSCNLL